MWYVHTTFVESEFAALYETKIDREGIVVNDPADVDGQVVVIQLDGFTQYIQANLYKPTYVRYGDRVWVRGLVKPVENFSDFDYIGFQQAKSIYASLKSGSIIPLKRGQGPRVLQQIHQVRQRMIDRLKQRFAETDAALVTSMLIGERAAIPDSVRDAFSRAGLSHVLAVSGFNVTILAVSIAWTAQFLGRRWFGAFSALSVVLFVILAGATGSVVRAGFMALVVITAQQSGRLVSGLYAVLHAALIMTLLNPRIVYWDLGFQLSVIATVGILVVGQLKRYESYLPVQSAVWFLLNVFAPIIATAPLIALHFETFSVIAPVPNVLLLPLVPLIMLFGFLSTMPLIGSGSAFVAELLLHFFTSAVDRFAALSFASIPLQFSSTMLYGSYVALIFAVIAAHVYARNAKRRVLQGYK